MTDSLKFCAHYSRPEIELLRAPTRAALISIRDPGSSRPAYESRTAAVCEVLVGFGWAYQSTRSEGRSRANRRLVQLLQREFELSR